jgi:hypothetical protein
MTSVISLGAAQGDGVRRLRDSYQWRALELALGLS